MIAFNAGAAVSIGGAGTIVRGDSIDFNGSGIVLAGNVAAPAPPSLNGASTTQNDTSVQGSIAEPDGTYRLDFFANPSATSGPSEGRTYLGSIVVTIGAGDNGSKAYQATFNTPVTPGASLTATATSVDLSGNDVATSTYSGFQKIVSA